MYRRSLAHVLGPFTVALILFVWFHAEKKLQQTPTLQPPPAPAVSEETPPLASQPSSEDTPIKRRSRVIEFEPFSDPKSVHALREIHAHLEKGNVEQAASQLQAFPGALLSDSVVRRHVAVLWNNLGILQEQQNGTEGALGAFRTAAALDPGNAIIQLNLAHAYWGLRDPHLTAEFLTHVIALAPNDPFPHLALADVLQEQDRLEDAGYHLQHARERLTADPSLQSYLTLVIRKLQRNGKIEDGLNHRTSAHFIVKFEGEEDYATWAAALDILEDAYREIGQELQHFPSKPVLVVLLTKDSFEQAADGPAWADGLFDPALGRIQLPTQGALTDRRWLTRVLRHEFVHALLHDEMAITGGGVPTWLNEGLAMHLSGDTRSDDVGLDESVKLVPLRGLEGGWQRLSPETAQIAYLEAGAITQYLVDRFGMQRLREILAALKSDVSFDKALENTLSISYEHLEKQWLEHQSTRARASS